MDLVCRQLCIWKQLYSVVSTKGNQMWQHYFRLQDKLRWLNEGSLWKKEVWWVLLNTFLFTVAIFIVCRLLFNLSEDLSSLHLQKWTPLTFLKISQTYTKCTTRFSQALFKKKTNTYQGLYYGIAIKFYFW